jgi:ABC-2 type transport system permease protein
LKKRAKEGLKVLWDDLRGAYYIMLKDLSAYYLKPPNISWGILFPVVIALAFGIQNPSNLYNLAPGLIAMSILFSTTSMEAIVITFEKRIGALERLFLAPISLKAILLGKILGGAVFGFIVTMAMLSGLLLFLEISIDPLPFLIAILLSSFTFSALGAFVSVCVREVFEAQTLANLFRFPMIFLCGVFIPISSLPLSLRFIGYFLPLTYSVDALRKCIFGIFDIADFNTSIFLLIIFSLIFFCSSLLTLGKRMEEA